MHASALRKWNPTLFFCCFLFWFSTIKIIDPASFTQLMVTVTKYSGSDAYKQINLRNDFETKVKLNLEFLHKISRELYTSYLSHTTYMRQDSTVAKINLHLIFYATKPAVV